jgi:redox-sensitive bicupin YhaK (pirin superfamily)
MTTKMKTLTFEQLPQSGFAGLIERHFVINQELFGRSKTIAFPGLGNFVYLADANFLPSGETHMHGHKEVDVISVMVEGEIVHHGSLGDGDRLSAGSVQVQRAGAEGFRHNEVNPNDEQNQMIQMWVLPDKLGEQAGYKVYQPESGQLTQVYGGNKNQQNTFNSKISVAVSNTQVEQNIVLAGEVLVYVSKGSALINSTTIHARSLVHCQQGVNFETLMQGQAIFIYQTDKRNEVLS